MAEPFIYTPTYSYSGYQASNPTRPLPAPKVDNDFAKISQSTSEIALALRDIRRSDGKLQNGLVTIQSLESSLSALIAAVPGLAAAAAVSAANAAASAGSAAVSAAAAEGSANVATAAAQRALENATGLVIATQAQAEAGVLNDKGMTPLRTKQQIDKTNSVQAPNVIQGGAANDGVTIARNAINAQIATTGRLALPDGRYKIDTGVLINKSNTQLVFSRNAFLLPANDGDQLVRIEGAAPNVWIPLSVDANADAAAITLASDPGWQVGNWIEIRSEAPVPGANSQGSKLGRLRKITGRSGVGPFVFALNAQLEDAYLVADSASAGRATVVENVVLDGLQCNPEDFATLISIGVNLRYAAYVRIFAPAIYGSKVRNAADIDGRTGIKINNCYDVEIYSPTVKHLGWYGIEVLGLSECVKVFGGIGEDVRHAVSVNWQSAGYGEPRDVLVNGMTGRGTNQAVFDTHDTGRDVRFSECLAEGSRTDAGFQIRNIGTIIRACIARDNALDGITPRNAGALDWLVDGCRLERNGRSGVNAENAGRLIRSRILDNGKTGVSGRRAVQMTGGEMSGCEVKRNAGPSVQIVPSVAEGQTLLRIDNLDAPTDGTQGNIFCTSGATFDLVEVRNSRLPSNRLLFQYSDATAANTAGRRGPRVSSGNSFGEDATLMQGEVTLVAGAATVVNSAIFSNNSFSSGPNSTPNIELRRRSKGGTTGALYVDNITSGTGFDIKSTSTTDTSVIQWRVTL